jgi:hypothetical protein
MYVNIAVLKETQPHERRFGMVPAVARHLQKLGGRLHMQPGSGAALNLTDADFPDAVFIDDALEPGCICSRPMWFWACRRHQKKSSARCGPARF